jgi:argininosuccinate lyase
MKLWQKSKDSLEAVSQFTAGKDSEMDVFLIPYDIQGSLAHITMLREVGLLSDGDWKGLSLELKKLHSDAIQGKIKIEPGVEDIHSQIEIELTRRLGEAGKKIHSGRSRNDQVLVDLKLFLRDEIHQLTDKIRLLFDQLLLLSEQHREKLLPGYTHFQLAMPSSFGLWFGSYAEGLADDLLSLQAAYRLVNKNPLGSAAGYGSSFPIDRELTTRLLGFEDLHVNVVYAQMSRGKTERVVAQAIGNVAATLARFAMDACLYLNPNLGFISFPDELTTGSSIMPHKKNPDVFEIVRARCNQLISLAGEVNLVTANLPSGYHRDMQVLKELIFPAFKTLRDCIEMANLMLSGIQVKENILEDDRYKFLFSVEEVNKLVLAGVPFRDAYRTVGAAIEAGKFSTDKRLNHQHIGSIGNLSNERIRTAFESVYNDFAFEKADRAIRELIG